MLITILRGSVLPNKAQITVQMESDQLTVVVEAIEDVVVEVVEQISWLAGVTGPTQVSLLEQYVGTRETGAKPSSKTVFFEPQVSSKGTGCFDVGFTLICEESHSLNHPIPSDGQCWKAMMGFALVAKGYSIPRRPHRASGLETRLPVLLDLTMGPDGPAVMRTARAAGGGKPGPLIAVGCEKGNLFYWHYTEDQTLVPTKLHASVDDGAVDDGTWPQSSRHFVGWSGDAGFLAGELSLLLYLVSTTDGRGSSAYLEGGRLCRGQAARASHIAAALADGLHQSLHHSFHSYPLTACYVPFT